VAAAILAGSAFVTACKSFRLRAGSPASGGLRQTTRRSSGTSSLLMRALHVSLDQLVFDGSERGPPDDLRPQFEAVNHRCDEDRQIIEALLDGMILEHRTRQMIGNLGNRGSIR
jgi:hypothetical protein